MRKILVVDDSVADRSLYKRFLSRPIGPERFTVLEASSGEEALALFRTERPDCVLLDYNLPDTDGLNLLTELQRLTPPDTLCAVVITGVGNETIAVTSLTNGALDYLVKQKFDAEMLYKTVVYAVDKNESRQDMARYHTQIHAVNRDLQASLEELTAVRQQLARRNAQLTAAHAEGQTRNQELGVTNEQLARTNVDLDNFIYTASHDLRAPIANIEGLLTALLEELGEAGLRSVPILTITQMMQESVERFKKTIDDLAEVTKLQKANEQRPVRVELAALIRDVQLDLAPLLLAAEADIEIDVEGCPAISFTEKNLRSVVYNLLSNALKYRSPQRPARVRIKCSQESDFIVLEVSDNGLGIHLTAERPLFTMFNRFHSHVEGSGIGLYMVKKIVENAGGRIEVKSQVGEGSTFRVFFRK